MSTHVDTRQQVSDTLFERFWAVYPLKLAKKVARKAWGELSPSPALVALMEAAIAWQAVQWARQGYGTPHAATWIRGERWLDEQPAATGKHLAPVHTEWVCPHVDPCDQRHYCEHRQLMPEKYPLKVSA